MSWQSLPHPCSHLPSSDVYAAAHDLFKTVQSSRNPPETNPPLPLASLRLSRVRTDKVDGFLLDRGFQIFLTSYPEVQASLDYPALDLKPFYAGAKVWWQGSFHQVRKEDWCV